MHQMRLDSKEGLAAGWAGISDARNLPERSRANGAGASAAMANGAMVALDADDEHQTPSRGFLRAVFRFARNAGIGLLLLTTVPFAAVTWQSQHLSTQRMQDVRLKLSDAERARVLRAPVDASITPMDAGLAFAALQAPQVGAAVKVSAFPEGVQQFPLRQVQPQSVWPWRAHKPGKELFAMRTGGFDGPAAHYVIESARSGFTAAEMAWLKELAEAPVWKNFDKVGAAQSMDLVGGQYQVPFRADAFSPLMPFAKFSYTKELAYAGVARAAYYVALGQPEQAEAALRSVVSFGFAMIDNGSFAIDGLIGKVIVGIGQNGFEQFAMYGGEFPAGYNRTPLPNIRNTNYGDPRGVLMTADEIREQLLKDIYDPTMPRTIRLEQLNQLSFSSCHNISEMWSGPNQETRDAFAMAAATLARYPSEKAQLAMMLDATNRVPDTIFSHAIGRNLVVGAATVASTITNNPRLATCTKMAVASW